MKLRLHGLLLAGLIAGTCSVMPLACVAPATHPYSAAASPSTDLDRGMERYNADDYDVALGFFQKAVQSDPNNAVTHNWLGWTNYELKKYDDAIAQFHIANNLKEMASNVNGLGEAYYDKGDFESALTQFSKWAKLEPTNWKAYSCLGWTCVSMGKYQEAIEHFMAANNIQQSPVNYSGLGTAYGELNNAKAALDAYSKALDGTPDATQQREIRVAMGYVCFAEGDYAKARELLRDTPCIGVDMEATERGGKVKKVVKGGPGYLAGVMVGDVLTEINGRSLAGMPVESVVEIVREIVRKAPFGSKLKVSLLRDGVLLEKDVIAGITPELEQLASKQPTGPAQGSAVTGAPPVAYSDNSSVAVVIGIGDYVFLGEIPGCKADATAFADAFQKARGMNPKRVILMTDDGDKSHVPGKAMIEERIKMCVAEVKPDGMALVYFSGHAVTRDGQAVLVPKDCEATNGIPVSWITAQLKDSKARDKVLIVDACHAGAAQKGVLVVARESFVNAEGIAMFLSCNKDESSYPTEGGQRSIYTDVFLRCLQDARADSSAITARSLEQRIEDRMSEWRLQTGKRQTPQLIIASDGDVTLVPGGKKQ